MHDIEGIVESVLRRYSDADLEDSETREILAEAIHKELILQENISLAVAEREQIRQEEWDKKFGKEPTLAVKLLAGEGELTEAEAANWKKLRDSRKI